MMKRKLLVIFLMSSFALSPAWSARTEKEAIQDENYKQHDAQILELLTYSQRAIEWRKEFIQHHNDMVKYGKTHQGRFSARDLIRFHDLANEYITRVQTPLKSLLKNDAYFLDFRDFFEIKLGEPTKISKVSRKAPLSDLRKKRNQRLKFKTIRVKKYSINPYDFKGQMLLRKFKVQLATKMVLMDNYALGLARIFEDKIFRDAIVNDSPVKYQSTRDELFNAWKEYVYDFQRPEDLFRAYGIIRTSKVLNEKKSYPGNSAFVKAIDQIIESSITFNLIKEKNSKINFFDQILEKISFMKKRRSNFYNEAGKEIVNELSKAFGNTAGLFQSRRGKLYNKSLQFKEDIKSNLKALDVLFEKTPFRLTDRFIPGHWGHAAIWVGSEKELKELGVWNELPKLYSQAVQRYGYRGHSFQEAVRGGHKIIEALRPGVQINSLSHFMDIDDLVAVRAKNCETFADIEDPRDVKCLTKEMKKEYLLEAFSQIGKDYDFNFDVNTENRIVCSELIYRSFLDVDFKTDMTLGRYSISPDQVAYKADEEGDIFEPVLLFFNGQEVEGDRKHLRDVFKLLLKTDYDTVERETGICQSYESELCQ